ncbi:MAG: family 78 glycoside hydrolase catalytic domain [Clostridia bacterium]|nr:family 78 glycoside hydrolase catalytic domain [Clostridia bacterium]
MRVTRLRCDYMENPVGFDFDRPQLGWQVICDGRDKLQSAYRIQVSTSDDFGETVYDSGNVMSSESVAIRLDIPLSARTRYYWRVRVWDEKDCMSDWSEAAFFETARMGEPWKAEWIGWTDEFPQLRRGFSVIKPVKSARAYACGVGMYVMFVNGEKAGNEYLTPNFNAYDSWLQYQTYDITSLIQQGENAIGAWLGNGYYKGRVNWPEVGYRDRIYGDKLAFIAEITIEYEDGTREVIITDESWSATKSPFLRTEIYDGEIFDAQAYDRAWSRPSTDVSGWDKAIVVPIDKKLLHARLSVPVVAYESRPAKLIITPKKEKVLDFGQNAAGFVRFKTRAKAGTRIHLQFGEELNRNGNFYRDNMRTALAENIYICDGREAVYEPYFTFFGFRYCKVSGLDEIDAEDFEQVIIHSKMDLTGSFSCSDERVNRLFLNALWSQRSNFVDVPTDCPQRDERMGWTGDAQVFCATAVMNADCDAFYRKFLYDLAFEQEKMGFVPVVVPFILKNTGFWEIPTTGWGDAATIMPWAMYVYYGDRAILERQYDSMKSWVEYMRSKDIDGKNLYGGFHIGDWVAQDTRDPDSFFGLTPVGLLATAYYALSSEILSKAAKVLGKDGDAAEYAKLAKDIREAFRNEYVSPAGRVVGETQTAQVIALYMNMLTDEQIPVTVEQLANRLRSDNMHLTTGFLGTPCLCPALSECGLNEYAYALLMQNTCPSWLYEVEKGATTIWERWNSIKEDGSFGPVKMNSFNHYAFGAVCEWLYRYVAGVNPDERAPGFKIFTVRPMPNDALSHAEASIITQYGEVKSGWKLEGKSITVEVEIPFNTKAEIILPDCDGKKVLENGSSIEGSRFTRGSGSWTYTYEPTFETISRRVVFPPTPRI